MVNLAPNTVLFRLTKLMGSLRLVSQLVLILTSGCIIVM